MSTDPLPLKGLPKDRVCKDCPPRPKPLKAPYPGPRCHRCNQKWRKLSKVNRAAQRIEARYGMPRWFRDRLWAYQGRTCAICARAKGITKAPAVEHDHAKPEGRESWRGLACAKCNDYLGYIRDDPKVGYRLARYLEDPPAQQLLREIAREEEEAHAD